MNLTLTVGILLLTACSFKKAEDQKLMGNTRQGFGAFVANENDRDGDGFVIEAEELLGTSDSIVNLPQFAIKRGLTNQFEFLLGDRQDPTYIKRIVFNHGPRAETSETLDSFKLTMDNLRNKILNLQYKNLTSTLSDSRDWVKAEDLVSYPLPEISDFDERNFEDQISDLPKSYKMMSSFLQISFNVEIKNLKGISEVTDINYSVNQGREGNLDFKLTSTKLLNENGRIESYPVTGTERVSSAKNYINKLAINNTELIDNLKEKRPLFARLVDFDYRVGESTLKFSNTINFAKENTALIIISTPNGTYYDFVLPEYGLKNYVTTKFKINKWNEKVKEIELGELYNTLNLPINFKNLSPEELYQGRWDFLTDDPSNDLNLRKGHVYLLSYARIMDFKNGLRETKPIVISKAFKDSEYILENFEIGDYLIIDGYHWVNDYYYNSIDAWAYNQTCWFTRHEPVSRGYKKKIIDNQITGIQLEFKAKDGTYIPYYKLIEDVWGFGLSSSMTDYKFRVKVTENLIQNNRLIFRITEKMPPDIYITATNQRGGCPTQDIFDELNQNGYFGRMDNGNGNEAYVFSLKRQGFFKE